MNADAEQSRAVARRFREDLWNSGDLAIADEIIAADCLIHARVPMTTDFSRGPDAIRQLVLFFHLAFADIHMTVEQVLVEGDMVAARWSGRGRHRGDLLGLPEGEHEAVTSGIDMLRIAGGKVVEGWVSWDTLGLIEHLLTAAPADAPPGSEPGAEFLSLLKRLR